MSTTLYIWDVQNDSYRAETDQGGNTTVSYTSEPEPYGHAVSETRDSHTSFFHYDASGSTREMSDENQAVLGRYAYDAFGLSMSQIGVQVTALRFVGSLGYYTHLEYDNVYIRHRHYCPSLGRWASADPVGSWRDNGYAYVASRVPNSVDPSGLEPFPAPPDTPDECARIYRLCHAALDDQENACDYKKTYWERRVCKERVGIMREGCRSDYADCLLRWMNIPTEKRRLQRIDEPVDQRPVFNRLPGNCARHHVPKPGRTATPFEQFLIVSLYVEVGVCGSIVVVRVLPFVLPATPAVVPVAQQCLRNVA